MAFLRAVGWLVSGFLFGLLQLWLVLFAGWFSSDNMFNWGTFIFSGSLLFFGSARMATIAVDQLFDTRRNYSRPVIAMLSLFPVIVLVVTAFVYGITYGKPIDKFDIHAISLINVVLLSMTAIYCIVVKTVSFARQG